MKELQVEWKRMLNFSTHSKCHLPNLCRLIILCQSLGAFTKLRKASITFVMSVCPFVLPSTWNNSAPKGRIFPKFDT